MDKLGNALGLPPIIDMEAETVNIKDITPPSVDNNDTVEKDYDYARENLMALIETGNKALEDMVDFARQAQAPRAYEIVATLITTLTNTNKDLMALSKTKKEIKKDNEK